jgi:hypothetical protein
MKSAKNFGMKPGDYHLVVDRSDRTLKCFDYNGNFKFAIPALAWGQHKNWRERNGDTPPGMYKFGVVYDTRGEAAYGPYCIDLIDLENQETGNGRSGISLHGGGSAAPDPFADFQPLYPTHGCIRVANAHLVHRILPLYKQGKNNVFVTVQD